MVRGFGRTGLIGRLQFVPPRLPGCVLWLRADAGVTRGVGMAAQFTAANSEYLSIADNASLSTGDVDFTLAAWVYFDSLTAVRLIAAKYGAAGNREYALSYQSSANKFHWQVFNDGTNSTQLTATTFGAPSTGTWYFVVVWHDSVANRVAISINAGPVDTAAHSTGVYDSTAALTVGAIPGSVYHDGRICGVGFWKRVLTAAERTTLYNAGVGLGYADVWSNGLTGSLVSYWDLAEPSGTRYDSFGSNNLADNATVTTNPGLLNHAVTTWADQSGSGNDGSQATQAAKPHLACDSLGRFRLRFNANDYLSANTLAASFGGVSTPFTCYVVASTTGGFGALCGAGRSSSDTPGQEFTLNPAMTMYRRVDGAAGGFTALSGSAPASNTLAVLRYSFDGATATITLNGGNVQTDPAYPQGAMTVDRFAIGAFERTTVTDYLTGDLAEMVVYSRDLSANERAYVRNYLGRRWLVGVA